MNDDILTAIGRQAVEHAINTESLIRRIRQLEAENAELKKPKEAEAKKK